MLGLSVFGPKIWAQVTHECITPSTQDALRAAILQVMEETNTPAAGVAMTLPDGSLWVEGLGLADKEAGRAATDETLFRLGSTSKIFIALAVLKLQEEGRLNLQDRVRDLAPEIEFTNPWEDTDPIRVVHLLEHTTGWDDLHLPEFAYQAAPDLSLREGLAFHPHSRVSKWVPGTRMAYCNSGANVAAYIVEQVTGMRFEDYVQSAFFDPMGMESMTYFASAAYQELGATLYHGPKVEPYHHLITRPSGALNASPRDMARLLQFFLRRGRVDSLALVSEASITRMEKPTTTLGAQLGLSAGYGLGLYSDNHGAFRYYKHGGAIKGGRSDFSYLPSHHQAYSVQINSDNGTALRQITSLIRDFQTQFLEAPIPEPLPVEASVPVPGGYYEIINPRVNSPMDALSLDAVRLWNEGDTLCFQWPPLLGDVERYLPVGGALYRKVDGSEARLAVVEDPLAGQAVEVGVSGGSLSHGKLSPVLYFGRWVVLLLWIPLLLWAGLRVPFWGVRWLRGRLGYGLGMRFWPLASAGFLVLSFMMLAMGHKVVPDLLARPSWISMAILLGTVAYFVGTWCSAWLVWRARAQNLSRWVWWPTALLVALQAIMSWYLLSLGLIGVRLWA